MPSLPSLLHQDVAAATGALGEDARTDATACSAKLLFTIKIQRKVQEVEHVKFIYRGYI